MSLRDWYAGMVLSGGMVNLQEHTAEEAVETSFDIADMMLKERDSQ